MKLTQKATSGEQNLNIVTYNPGLKTEFQFSCSNLPKTILDFANICVLPDFLPQPSNFFTRIYPPYPWHFATLGWWMGGGFWGRGEAWQAGQSREVGWKSRCLQTSPNLTSTQKLNLEVKIRASMCISARTPARVNPHQISGGDTKVTVLQRVYNWAYLFKFVGLLFVVLKWKIHIHMDTLQHAEWMLLLHRSGWI